MCVCVSEVWKETLQTAVAGKSNAIQVENAKPKGRAAEHWTRRWRGRQLTAAQWYKATDFFEYDPQAIYCMKSKNMSFSNCWSILRTKEEISYVIIGLENWVCRKFIFHTLINLSILYLLFEILNNILIHNINTLYLYNKLQKLNIKVQMQSEEILSFLIKMY